MSLIYQIASDLQMQPEQFSYRYGSASMYSLPVLNGELHILHIMIMVLQSLANFHELLHKPPGTLSPSERWACGVRTPATTSSPCALIRNSPISSFSPVAGSRVNATPVPDVIAHVTEYHRPVRLQRYPRNTGYRCHDGIRLHAGCPRNGILL